MAERDGNGAFLREHAAEVAAAAERIRAHVRRTPLLTIDLDPRLRLKPESFQRTGSFKARGAFNAVLRLRREHPETKGVIGVSSGNPIGMSTATIAGASGSASTSAKCGTTRALARSPTGWTKATIQPPRQASTPASQV